MKKNAQKTAVDQGSVAEVITKSDVGSVAAVVAEVKETKSVSSKDKVAFFQPLIAEGKYSAAELMEMAKSHFPKLTESTIKTFLTDSKNAKYNKFEKLVVVTEEKKLAFAA